MIYLGIDPGVSGGFAALSERGDVLHACKMPDTDLDVLTKLLELRGVEPSRAVLEFVRSSPAMGVVSAFTFGRGYGALKMALVAATIPYEEVTPQRWQKALGCRTGGDKNVSKRKAQELFPATTVKITHAIADALLLAEYCRRLEVRK